jgi:hypothetical protein
MARGDAAGSAYWFGDDTTTFNDTAAAETKREREGEREGSVAPVVDPDAANPFEQYRFTGPGAVPLRPNPKAKPKPKPKR